MKKYPRWAAMLLALTVILTSILAPLEGIAAPGPIRLPDDPKLYFGDPDGPTGPMTIIRIVPGGLTFIMLIPIGIVRPPNVGSLHPAANIHD